MFTTAVQVDLIGSHGLLILCPKSRCGPSNSPKLVCGAVSQRLAMSAHLRGSALDWPAWRVPVRYVRRIFVQPGPGLPTVGPTSRSLDNLVMLTICEQRLRRRLRLELI